MALEAVEVTDTDVVTRVVVPGFVSNHKGINLPGVTVSVPALTEKDKRRPALGAAPRRRHHRPVVRALGRRRRATCARSWTRRASCLPVIAKIEKPQAIDNLDDVIEAFDGFMVARGDLGVECPLEDVPFLQKRSSTPRVATPSR